MGGNWESVRLLMQQKYAEETLSCSRDTVHLPLRRPTVTPGSAPRLCFAVECDTVLEHSMLGV